MNKIVISLACLMSFIFLSCTNKATSIKEQNTQDLQIKENNQKVVLITIDGLRWQEVFGGIEDSLVHSEYTKHPEIIDSLFGTDSQLSSREKLMPFLWNTIENNGQIYGNRNFENKVNVANAHWFSYPGYNEILTGYADNDFINSNDKVNNRNKTILEIANNDERYAGKVGAFGSWDVFPYIINESRSGLYVNAGYRKAIGSDLSDKEKYLNKLQDQAIQPWTTVRQDVFTHNYALEYMKREQPNLLYISYGETDDFAHDGNYEQYLLATKNTDQMIKELWEYCLNNSFYRDNTVFIITTDHGRGTKPLEEWKSHGQGLKYHGETFNIIGSDETWLAVIGNNIPAKGEVKSEIQLYNNQIYSTISKLLNLEVPTDSKANVDLLPFVK